MRYYYVCYANCLINLASLKVITLKPDTLSMITSNVTMVTSNVTMVTSNVTMVTSNVTMVTLSFNRLTPLSHVIVSGYITTSTVSNFMRDFLHPENENQETTAVFLNP